jgi:hypothetical protein
MRMVLVICLRHSCFSCSYSNLKKWCRCDRSHASSVLVVHWSVVRSMIPLCWPLMVSSIVSMGDLAEVTPGSQRLVVVPVSGVPSAGGATQGATGVGVVGASPQLGDGVGSLLWDLVICGTNAGVPGSAVLGDAAPALRS